MDETNEPNIRDTIVALYNNGASMADVGKAFHEAGVKRRQIIGVTEMENVPDLLNPVFLPGFNPAGYFTPIVFPNRLLHRIPADALPYGKKIQWNQTGVVFFNQYVVESFFQ